MDSYEILVGVGTLYVAPVGTTFPAVSATPAAPWVSLGETDGGVKVTPSQKINVERTDQRTGAVKAMRSEEDIAIETNLVQATYEKLAVVLNSATLTDTAPGSGTIGTREIPLYRGTTVAEVALVFRGVSPYAAYNAQFQVPRGYFDGDTGLAFQKDKKVLIPVKFMALEDLNAVSSTDRFGKVIAQDAAAT